MIYLFYILFINLTFATTIESDCQKIEISRESIRFNRENEAKCRLNKLKVQKLEREHFKKTNLHASRLYLNSLENNKIKKFDSVMIDSLFCKIPMVEVYDYDLKNNNIRKLWSAENHFNQLVSIVLKIGILTLDTERSKKENKKICEPFPEFEKAVKFSSGLMPGYLKNLNTGGYIVFTSKLPTIFFMNKKMNNIEFAKNLANGIKIKDMFFKKNGDLLVLIDQWLNDKKKFETCLEYWDISSNVLMKKVCGFQVRENAPLVDIDDEPRRVFRDQKSIWVEALQQDGSSKNILELKNVQNFDLEHAIVY